MSYAPVNNTMVVRGSTERLNELINDNAVYDKIAEVSNDVQPRKNFTLESDDAELWFHYETNGEPHEEVPEFIKKKYPDLRVFFSSIDYDEFCFAYYKEIGKPEEYNYHTLDEEKIDEMFEDFISK